ncbi:unnamed protein product [Eretmochelys imbricata]
MNILTGSYGSHNICMQLWVPEAFQILQKYSDPATSCGCHSLFSPPQIHPHMNSFLLRAEPVWESCKHRVGDLGRGSTLRRCIPPSHSTTSALSQLIPEEEEGIL